MRLAAALLLLGTGACSTSALPGETEARARAEAVFGVSLKVWHIGIDPTIAEYPRRPAGVTYCLDDPRPGAPRGWILLTSDDWTCNAFCHEVAHIAEGCGTNLDHVGWLDVPPGGKSTYQKIDDCQIL